jgi:hypothetical protein
MELQNSFILNVFADFLKLFLPLYLIFYTWHAFTAFSLSCRFFLFFLGYLNGFCSHSVLSRLIFPPV